MALSMDMTFWINTLIFNKLDEICSSLNLNGEDRRVYDICKEDFKNYINYLDRNHLRVEDISTPSPMTSLEEVISIMIGETGLPQNLESTKEIVEFIDTWVRGWLKKWVQRTKIIFNAKDLPSDASKAPSFLPDIFTGEEHRELMRGVTDKLIQYGEICCTQIMADALYKKAMEAANSASKKEWTMQDKLNFLCKLQREAKQMSYTHGPLVFIRPDNYYKVREWRSDGANKIV